MLIQIFWLGPLRSQASRLQFYLPAQCYSNYRWVGLEHKTLGNVLPAGLCGAIG